MIEIFIDKVTVFTKDEDKPSAANKNLIIKLKFGPKQQFILKEGQLAKEDRKDDIIECDENGRKKWTRTIRVGKSFLFPSFPDTIQMILSKFPLEIEVWNDDENETEIFVGLGTMLWDTKFYHMLKEATNPKALHDPLTIKQKVTLYAECCCGQCGEITFILRLAPLGDSITTEFQQLMKDPDVFVFRTNKAPSTFQCKRIEGDDPNFNMIGSLYETATLEDPEIQEEARKKIEVCTELQSCGNRQGRGGGATCEHHTNEGKPKKYAIDKIRMGDITGPCGNKNCQLAHKVKTYIRALDSYKAEAAGKVSGNKDENVTKKVCGGCTCKDDRYHRDTCPDKTMEKVKCKGCGGAAHTGDTCEDRIKQLYGTGATPSGSKTRVGYVLSVPNFKDALFRNDYIVENMEVNYNYQQKQPCTTRSAHGCCCKNQQFKEITNDASSDMHCTPSDTRKCTKTLLQEVYNVSTADSKRRVQTVYNCTQTPDDKDCKCDPIKPTPPCNTFDCDCITEIANKSARKTHKPYCPLYKHKPHCPILTMDSAEEKLEEDEDETEPLPYGLPPIQLGPCPVLGRPCTVPDGFARMYRNAVLPALPPSYDDAGKVCCSKEYDRIKKAIKEYMKNEKDHDYRCINKFNVDVETRCCDKEQRLKSLMGKGCCGSHKMAIQEKFADK